jgi:hypothetical protein
MIRPLLALLLVLTLAACNRSQPAPAASQDSTEQKPAAPAAPPPPNAPAAGDTGSPDDVTPGAAPKTATPPDANRLAAESHGRAAPDASAEAPAPPEPTVREITVPSGTTLPLELETSLASNTNQAEDPVRARLRRALVVNGVTVAPAGTPVTGVVTAAAQSGKVKGVARIAFRFTSLQVGDERYDIRTSAYSQQSPTTRKKDAAKIGVPAAGGALIGGLIGGKKGAAIGAATGGGAGTAVVMSTRGEEVQLPAGTSIAVRLLESLPVHVPVTRN